MKLIILALLFAFTINAISQNKSSQQTTYYQYDGNGNVVNLTDNAGSTIEKYSYDAFGKPTIKDLNDNTLNASAFDNRFMFTGREFIKEVSLYDYRNRIYSAVLGKFLQTDPLRFTPGDYNLYRYVWNSPTNNNDPFGYGPPGWETNSNYIEMGESGYKKQKTRGNWHGGKFYPLGDTKSGIPPPTPVPPIPTQPGSNLPPPFDIEVDYICPGNGKLITIIYHY